MALHHGLRGIRQPCVNGDWLCQWEMAIFDPPQNPHPLTDHQKRNLKKNYLYLFFMNSPTGQTGRRIFTLDGSNDADSRKDVPFGGFVDSPHFGREIPRKPPFWGRE